MYVNFVKTNKMKKILFIALIALMSLSTSAKTRRDKLTGDLSVAADTLNFSTKLHDCNGKKVTFTLAIKTLGGGIDIDWYIIGQDKEINYDYSVVHWESIIATGLPFVVDTTDVTHTITGMGYFVNGTNYVYTKTIIIDDYPWETPGVYFDLNTTTQGLYTIYITVEDGQ